jgi:gamma-glutamylcyclotransferase (GGCT)/AIG2-like uncharacterized protein YtfP
MIGNVDLLFVYGTLRERAAHPMAAYLWRRATPLGLAKFQGRMYRVAHYPGVVASDDPADQVTGTLLRLGPRFETTLRQLDRYEGYSPADKAGSLFVREKAQVTDTQGRTHLAWIYLYNRPVAQCPRIVSGDFFKP